jgi:molybdenum cofactor biosynthesis protein MoaC
MGFTHLDNEGQMCMVDVSAKPRLLRSARAAGRIVMQPETIRQLRDMHLKKGDALAAARVAGIQAAKQTFALIPLCHNIRIDQVSVDFTFGDNAVDIEARAVCVESTGIEMEALTAVSVAALTLYDMCKAVDKTMRIEGIHLAEKTKGAAP